MSNPFVSSRVAALNFIVLTYVAVSATEIGIPEDFAFYFVAFVNASSLFGRYCAGSIADRFGQCCLS